MVGIGIGSAHQRACTGEVGWEEIGERGLTGV